MEVTEIYAAVNCSMSRVEWGGSRNSGKEQSGNTEGVFRPTDQVMFEMACWDPDDSRGTEEAGAPVPVGQGLGWGVQGG